eukprot:TRINITY_DN495_c1_g1_i3.p1 TRINITY_DN495_c1_g1~~TRINITY_DN495_c1_g1_i3.p1  ORF type:complete len:278 (-),score=110.85 TRINITY_DN495_c1_g1_i3:105-896(-)
MSQKCPACGKAVFAMEAINVDKVVFHKAGCFKCVHCKKTLSPGNYAGIAGKFYCKPHFKQLFALKGDYASAFGEKKPAEKWAQDKGPQPEGAGAPAPAPATAATPAAAPAPAAAPSDAAPAPAAATPAPAPAPAPAAAAPAPAPVPAPAPASAPAAGSPAAASRAGLSRSDVTPRLATLKLSGLTMDDVEKAQAKFKACDLDGNGVIDRDEFAKIIKSLNPGKSEFFLKRLGDQYFNQYDTNHNGTLDEIEFLRVYSDLMMKH